MGINKIDAFLEAALLDGEADASGDTLSERWLAKHVGVSRATLRKWRGHQNYQSRRRFVAWREAQG